MKPVWHLVKKEFLLLARDWHALLLLFLMPAGFILVMSLALQGQFSSQSDVHIDFYLVSQDSGAINDALLQRLGALDGFKQRPSRAGADTLRARVRAGQARFLVTVPAGFGKALASDEPMPVQIEAAPDISAALYQLFQARLRGLLARLRIAAAMGADLDAAAADDGARALLSARMLYGDHEHHQRPSSVQQNVPAWLLFAMFFIAIPLSTTWVQERQQGTYARLRSMGLGAPALLAGKLVPYVLLNLVQVVLMLAVGVYLLPLLGGGQLTLGHSWAGLALVAGAASFAAVGYALLVANLVSSSEQATIFTGVANLLMAAVGGIMVPRFIMPQAMQRVSEFSPMAWGLDGFLDIFLRGGGVAMAWGEAWKLLAFGGVCLVLTAAWMRWRNTS